MPNSTTLAMDPPWSPGSPLESKLKAITTPKKMCPSRIAMGLAHSQSWLEDNWWLRAEARYRRLTILRIMDKITYRRIRFIFLILKNKSIFFRCWTLKSARSYRRKRNKALTLTWKTETTRNWCKPIKSIPLLSSKTWLTRTSLRNLKTSALTSKEIPQLTRSSSTKKLVVQTHLQKTIWRKFNLKL